MGTSDTVDALTVGVRVIILAPGKNSFLDTVLMLLKMCLWTKDICIYVTLGEKGRRGQGKGW